MINAALLTGGATVVAVSVFITADLPGWLTGAAWLIVLGGLLYALIRSRWTVAAAAAAVAVAWAVWVVALRHPAPLASSDAELPRAVSAVLLIALVAVLGSMREPRFLARKGQPTSGNRRRQ